jgi:hypothetical protein
MEKATKEIYYEWGCRILLTAHVLFTIYGYINYAQTRHELFSPLIPQSTVIRIAESSLFTGKYIGGLLLISLWFYFFRKRIACMVISGISLVAHEYLVALFTRGSDQF